MQYSNDIDYNILEDYNVNLNNYNIILPFFTNNL